ncbi:beta-mannosidase [Arthrobacter sp. AG258]|uniref:glycoside hydrolase family 2 protein n=1 Tax=Arthrobacter sp. AG258 TaxID=2183899 RepID=UPI00105DB491|nr:glycoside hydrolase family 2 protein [Arthrobacter sp. AG258]TDT74671.1 beta-mannosidase [Arthrobacter sp. AG258]
MLTTQKIHEGWTVAVETAGRTSLIPAQARALIGESIPAAVPGSIHTDLLRQGIIPDPFIDANELDVAWVGRSDWSYQTSIRWDSEECEQIDLVFDGLDTVADVVLDGVTVGQTRNMHRSYRFDVTRQLKTGVHDLAVRFTSAYTEAEKWQAALGDRPNAYPEPFHFIRKMACSFGWDWGPTLVTAGIWRPARLEGWSTARISSVRPLTDVADGVGTVDFHVDIERTHQGADRSIDIEVTLEGGPSGRAILKAGQNSTVLTLTVEDARVWQPRGYGSQELYHASVRILDAGTGTELDIWGRRIGFRHVELDREIDEVGSQFLFRINGVGVFAKGVNWIPDDIFPSEMTPERYRKRLEQAAEANCNMVRVWGGGLYEDDAFYDACDELGLMVWQDFLFACASYPEEEPFRSEVIAEARENVARLSSHPSLVIWNGNNENLWMRKSWSWADKPGGELSWGEGFYLDVLPEVVASVDPSRPYTEGSPWSGSKDLDPNDPDHQTFHSWGVWNAEDYSHYLDSAPRFVSEFGWQAPPTWATLRRAVTDNPILPDSPGVLHHQKADDGNGKLARGLEPHFPAPVSTNAWHYLTQLNQVRAIRTGVDHWRAHWPHTAGTIVWQLNDLWPVTSWSAIDGDGRFKPLYHALREMYAQRVLAIQETEHAPTLTLVNDSPEPWEGTVAFRRLHAGGTVLSTDHVEATVAPYAVGHVALPEALTEFGDPTTEFVVADLGDARALWFPVEDVEFRYPGAAPAIEVVEIPGGLEVKVTAAGLVRDLLLQADRIAPDATVDRGFTTLLPGESVVFRLLSEYRPGKEALELPYVLTHLQEVLAEARVSMAIE